MNDTHISRLGYDETTPVLIVGGSLVGLSTSLFLSWHGIPSLLVERHAGISPHPRAFNFNMRTMELFRSVGVEEAVRKAEPPEFRNSSVLQAESLAGKELSWISQDTTGSTLSPVQGSITGQDLMEPILRARAEELGGDLRFQTECVSFAQDAEGVSAVLRERTSGRQRTVRARYLVAADGNHSAIRQQLGIEVDGPGVQGHQLSLLFSANIQEALRGRRIAICFVSNPTIRGGTLILARGEGRGYGLYAHYHPEKGERSSGQARNPASPCRPEDHQTRPRRASSRGSAMARRIGQTVQFRARWRAPSGRSPSAATSSSLRSHTSLRRLTVEAIPPDGTLDSSFVDQGTATVRTPWPGGADAAIGTQWSITQSGRTITLVAENDDSGQIQLTRLHI